MLVASVYPLQESLVIQWDLIIIRTKSSFTHLDDGNKKWKWA